MAEGGKRLAEIKERLKAAVKPGATPLVVDQLADKLIEKTGGKASFKLVPGYSHATCINANEVVVHGIPNKREFEPGDVVGIDVGLYYKGFHTDTSTSVIVSDKRKKEDKEKIRFLNTGKMALKSAISRARAGKRVADISQAMQETVEGAGYRMVKALTGHGIGRQLHEEPAVPCFVIGEYQDSPRLKPGMVLAIEVMYNLGTSDVMYKNTDGWTIITGDGKISGLFEETVVVTETNPVVLTQTQKDE